MYKEFYGFSTYPFPITPDPQFLYLSKNHGACLRYLLHGLERGHGLIVLTGETGTGKTSLLKNLAMHLDEKTHTAFLVNSALDSNDMLSYVFHELDLDITGKSKFEMLSGLKKFLLTLKMVNEKVVLIIDEAQNLSIDTLENLRLLTNFEDSGKKLLQIILAGQPHLEATLRLPELTQLNQRIGFHCCLTPLGYDETKGYIENRLTVARAIYPVFTSRAIKKIFVHSKGVPRVINVICDNALIFGFSHQKRKIGHVIIQQVVQELRLDGVERVEKHQSQDSFRRAKRLALIAGIASLSLLGVGFVLQPSLPGGKLREYTRSVANSLAVLSQSPTMVESPAVPSLGAPHQQRDPTPQARAESTPDRAVGPDPGAGDIRLVPREALESPRLKTPPATPSGRARTSCDELKAKIQAQLDATGITGYALTIMASGDVQGQQIVGSCAGNTKKIAYTRSRHAP
jgi:general secretion pathway protein A